MLGGRRRPPSEMHASGGACTSTRRTGGSFYHYFTTLVAPKKTPRRLLDDAIPLPTCPDPKHAKYKVRPNGTYTTAGGERQRYRCYDPDNPEVTKHTFTTPLPRSAVSEETCCPDCEVPTPKHAGAEAPTRRMSYPASVIYSVLHDLAEGRAYTYASMRRVDSSRMRA